MAESTTAAAATTTTKTKTSGNVVNDNDKKKSAAKSTAVTSTKAATKANKHEKSQKFTNNINKPNTTTTKTKTSTSVSEQHDQSSNLATTNNYCNNLYEIDANQSRVSCAGSLSRHKQALQRQQQLLASTNQRTAATSGGGANQQLRNPSSVSFSGVSTNGSSSDQNCYNSNPTTSLIHTNNSSSSNILTKSSLKSNKTTLSAANLANIEQQQQQQAIAVISQLTKSASGMMMIKPPSCVTEVYDQLREVEQQQVFFRKKLLDGRGSQQHLMLHHPSQIALASSNGDRHFQIKDKCKFVYITFFLYGLSVMLPWNIFLTATDFFVNYKLNTPISQDSYYQKNFQFFMSLIWHITFLFMSVFNLFNCDRKFNQNERIPFFIMLSVVSMAALVGLSIINSSKWPFSFFICTSLIVFFNAVASGMLNSCAFYSAGIFPMKYTNAIVLGNCFSGLFGIIIIIVNKAISANLAMVSIFFFVITFGMLLVTFIGYFALPLSMFYRFHMALISDKHAANAAVPIPKLKMLPKKAATPRKRYTRTMQRIWPFLFYIWLIMFTTTIVFPFYQQKIKQSSATFIVSSAWFIDITCYLAYHLMMTLGSLTTLIMRRPGPKWIIFAVLLKATGTIGFFITCNFEAEQRKSVPVFVQNDYLYAFGALLSPYLSGYLISLLMMYTPKQTRGKYSGIAGMLAALALTIGSFSGTQFSRVLEQLTVL